MADIKIMFCDFCRTAVSVTDREQFEREHAHCGDTDD